MGESIWECFHLVRDPRVERTRKHELHDMLVITICAVICDADGWNEVEEFGVSNEEWFRGFLDLPHGIPSHDTFGRVFAALLFDVISRAYERTSLIVTTNLPFESWVEVMGSERLTGALLDRLTHRVHIVEANGESFRLRESKRRQRRKSGQRG